MPPEITMQTTIALDDLVKGHPFLTNLRADFCDFLVERADIRRFASRQRVFHEGDEADHFYLIISGSVMIETFVPENGVVPIQHLGEGDAFGWSWIFPPYRWNFSASTTAPTQLISFNAVELRARAAEDIEFRDALMTRITRTVLDRLEAARRRLVELHSVVLAAKDSATAGALNSCAADSAGFTKQ